LKRTRSRRAEISFCKILFILFSENLRFIRVHLRLFKKQKSVPSVLIRG